MPVFSQKFIGVTLPMRLGQSGYFEASSDIIQQTRSNVKNLVLTKKGERLINLRLGCDVWNILYEQLTPESIERAKISIIDAFTEFLPFLEVVDFQVQELVPNEHAFRLLIVYRFLNNPNVVDGVEVDSIIGQNTELNSNLTSATNVDKITTRKLSNGTVVRGGTRGVEPVPAASMT